MSQQTILKYKNLELLCKSNTIEKYRQGNLQKDKVIIANEIFKSIKKANRANTIDLKKVFKTTDIDKCIDIMLDKGEYQLSTEERKEKVIQRKLEIINYIHINYIDPKTKILIPKTRIESALDETKIKIDTDIAFDKLIQQIIKKMVSIIPMKLQTNVNIN